MNVLCDTGKEHAHGLLVKGLLLLTTMQLGTTFETCQPIYPGEKNSP